MVKAVVSLSLWRPRFSPVAAHGAFVVDTVALGQEFLQVLWFSPLTVISHMSSILIFHYLPLMLCNINNSQHC
jgi:hypothetical protein